MKTLDRTKLAVLIIGTLTTVVSLIGVAIDLNLTNYFFPLYAGLTLVGVSLLHNDATKEGKSDNLVIEK
ncbi:hypothetical protein J8L85_06530 [Maribacter sp. MMG018]|uniref:hypothetical protein n=1 Tax=Maribacter sp. MMG018 TaxID=2822688 RepID=UPI001B3857DD|nr:hypothetical protein [Maribacter sp. MMG018]MBQ4914083.1 hypothetical protein [Maribacter sp. MMG018]